MQGLFEAEFSESQQVFEAFLSQESIITSLNKAAECMIKSLSKGGKIISCGNGGSMTDAMHFAEELCGKFRSERESFPAIAISDPSFLSCVANDYGYDSVFSRFVEGMGKQGDVLLAISTSGSSKNVLRAAETAHKKNMHIIALTGMPGSELQKQADYCITVPHSGYADRIQEVHIKIIHAFIHAIEQHISFSIKK